MQPRQLGTSDLTVSPIGLGTVEIGLAYDIADKELPSEEVAETILKSAVDMDVMYIDTARGYGVAEERIGKSGIVKESNVVVGTKCAQWLRDEPRLTGEELKKRIRDDVDASRKFLQLDSLPLVQLHVELPDYPNLDELIEIMADLKDKGAVQNIGIATRGETLPLAAIASGFFVSLQTAYSILDQRMAAQVLPAAAEAGVGIISRSVLLKGALTPKRSALPAELSLLKKNADSAEEIAKEHGMDLPTLAMRFVLSNPAISTALVGTVNPAELQAAVAAAEAGPLPNDITSELKELAINDPDQVDPARWPKF